MMHVTDDSDIPPSIFADEVDAKRHDEEEEGDTESESSGESGTRKPVDEKIKIDRRYVDDYLDSDLYEEGWLEKLKSLALMPFSMIMPGASALAAENDLSRRLMMGRFGLFNKQILPQDMADPDLINKLEERFQERRERVMRELGLGIAPPLSAMGFADGLKAKSKGDKTPKNKQAKVKKEKGISFAEKEVSDSYGADKKSSSLTSTTSFALSGDEELLRKINNPDQGAATTITPELDLTDLMSDFDPHDHDEKQNASKISFAERLANIKDKVIDVLSGKSEPTKILSADFEAAAEGKNAAPLQIQVLREELKLDVSSVTPTILKPFGS